MLRFAANLTMLYTEFGFLERFAAAASDGFEAVEYLFPYAYPAEQLAELLERHHLQQVLFNAPPGLWDAGDRGMACVPGREREFRNGIDLALDYAQALDCPRVHAMAGIAPAGVDRELLRATYVANIAWAAHRAADAGRLLMIEPINEIDMPGYFLNRQEDAHAIVAEIGAQNLKVQMDLYHCRMVEGDVNRELHKYLDSAHESAVGHIQIAGVPGRHEPDSGDLHYDPLFDWIEEAGYKGWIGLEYRPAGGTSEGLKWLRRRLGSVHQG
jgi:hydroxypyruvate isomerase